MDHYKLHSLENYVIVSPDAGRANRVRAFARRLKEGLPIAIVDKRRIGPNQALVLNVIGDVKGKTALIYDDMLDTGGTIVEGARAIAEQGAKEVFACIVHPLFSGNASQRIVDSCIKELVITDTIVLASEKNNDKLKILSVAGLLGKAILRIHNDESISSLFKEVE